MTVSHWRRVPVPRLVEADVVIIGAGICGLSAALAFSRRGLRTAVVERHTVGSGASTRNAGFLMRGAAENYAAAIGLYGRELARLVWRWTEENLAGLRAEGLGALPSYRAVPSCLLALGGEELEELTRSVDLLREDGFGVGWMGRGDDSVWRHGRPMGGLLNPDDGAVNPAELMRLLAAKAGPIFEEQEVFAVEAGLRSVVLRTADMAFAAPRILVCTNAYAPLLLPAMGQLVAPRRGQMLAIRAEGLRLDCSYYANHGYEYFRQGADGTVVVGGCRRPFADAEVGYEDMTTGPVQGALERFTEDRLGVRPGTYEVTARWAGAMGFSPDGLPLIGPVPGSDPRVWFCGGFTGHGMSMAYRAAHAAAAAMLDGAENPLPLTRAVRAGRPAEGVRL
jgi:gamma-glutamylputrescine oxidase